MALREVLEASEAHRAGILGPESLQAAISTSTRLIARDPGIPEVQRDLLQRTLNSPGGSKPNLRFDGLEYCVIQQLHSEIDQRYLERWADAISQTQATYGPERTARAVASHLLDQGFSSGFLHRWLTYQLKHQKTDISLADALRELSARSQEPPKQFDVLMVFPSRLDGGARSIGMAPVKRIQYGEREAARRPPALGD